MPCKVSPLGAASTWWLRSPNTGNATNFYNITTSGSNNNNNASNAYGVAFGSSHSRQSNRKAKSDNEERRRA